jgi:hypothetical protein
MTFLTKKYFWDITLKLSQNSITLPTVLRKTLSLNSLARATNAFGPVQCPTPIFSSPKASSRVHRISVVIVRAAARL